MLVFLLDFSLLVLMYCVCLLVYEWYWKMYWDTDMKFCYKQNRCSHIPSHTVKVSHPLISFCFIFLLILLFHFFMSAVGEPIFLLMGSCKIPLLSNIASRVFNHAHGHPFLVTRESELWLIKDHTDISLLVFKELPDSFVEESYGILKPDMYSILWRKCPCA